MENSRFPLSDVGCRKTLLTTADGRQHLLLRVRHRALQLYCVGAPLDARARAIALLADDLPDVEAKLKLMRRFAGIVRPARGAQRPPAWTPQALALRNALIALDGRLNGASHRQVAQVIFGHERARHEWQGGQGWMKSRIARAARKGAHLAQGGYRVLLAASGARRRGPGQPGRF